MTIEELGSIGEFLGLFAVLATLIYLAIQTRQTRSIAAAESVRAQVADYNNIWAEVRANDDMARLLQRGLTNWNGLRSSEQVRLNLLFVGYVTQYLALPRGRRRKTSNPSSKHGKGRS